jgi:hypothetical protein
MSTKTLLRIQQSTVLMSNKTLLRIPDHCSKNTKPLFKECQNIVKNTRPLFKEYQTIFQRISIHYFKEYQNIVKNNKPLFKELYKNTIPIFKEYRAVLGEDLQVFRRLALDREKVFSTRSKFSVFLRRLEDRRHPLQNNKEAYVAVLFWCGQT